jgi:CO/xanthine dehydrogenase FAD-binding subunit
MVKTNQTVLIAKTLSDVFYHVNSVSGLQIVGGCTYVDSIEEKSLTVRAIPELSSFEKRERYIDFGPSVTLSQMISIGRNKMPAVLYDALTTIATPAVRNLATLGGNICGSKDQKLSLYAPLLALEARLELRSQNETRYVPFSKFEGVPRGFVLTKIRVPVDEWEIAIFRRVGPSNQISPLSAGFIFLADTQKDILTNIRIAFAGGIVFRSQELENKLIGTRLPLSVRIIETLVDEANTLYDEAVVEKVHKPILKAQFLNLLRYSLEQLT